MILVWEDFADYDNDFFMLFPLKGYYIPLSIWPENGRFFPFSMQEFNLIRHFTNTPIGYYFLPIAQLLVFFCILLILDADLSITARTGLAILALLTPSVLISFGGLLYEERNVMLLPVCLVLSVKQFEKTKAVGWAVAAVVCAQIMLYFKETDFLLLLGFAGGRLILRSRDGQHAAWDYERLWDQESRLDLCLASLALLFLVSYFAVMGIHGNIDYATRVRHPMAEVVLDYLRLDLLVWLFVAVVLSRIYMILRQRTVPWLLWDGLAFGAVAYLLTYVYLGMFRDYYLAPVDLITILYIGRIAVLSWSKIGRGSKIAIAALGSIIFFQDALGSTFFVFVRKDMIQAKTEIASAVRVQFEHRIQNDGQTVFSVCIWI